MFAGGLSSMIGDGNGIQDDDTEANAGMILNFLGNQVSMNINDSIQPPKNIYSQCPEINSNKISNIIHKNYLGLTSMLQGFQKCIA